MLTHLDKGVVHDPVAKGRGADDALFGLANLEVDVGAGAVVAAGQVVVQVYQVFFQAELEGRGRRVTAFTARGFAVSQDQVGPGVNVGVSTGDVAHHDRIHPVFFKISAASGGQAPLCFMDEAAGLGCA